MKVLELAPPLKKQCQYCNSLLEVERDDINCEADPVWKQKQLGWPDFACYATCCVCQKKMSMGWLYQLPSNWRSFLLVNSGLTEQVRF